MDYRNALVAVDRYLEAYLALGILSVYTVIIVGDTLRRVILGRQTLWGHEVVVAMFIWMSWIAASYVVRWNGHLRFTFFLRDFSRRRQGWVAILESVCWILFAAVVAWHSVSVFETYLGAGRTFSGTDIPSWLSYLSIPVCFSLILVRSVQRLVIALRKYRAGEAFDFQMEDPS